MAKHRAAPNRSFRELLKIEETELAGVLTRARHAVEHPGEKGRVLEEQATALLRRFLPAEYGVCSGFIACATVDANDNHRVVLGPQTDVIVFDATRGAPLVDLGGTKVVPLECVHAAVEVKASLRREVKNLYAWSARTRELRTRHYVFDRDREVDPLAQAERSMRVAQAFAGNGAAGGVLEAWVPRHVTYLEWLPIRCFAIAFELGDRRGSVDGARAWLRKAFVDPGHFHAILVPNSCTLWNRRADEDPSQLGEVDATTETPLGTFRLRLLDALANFPRPTVGTTMNLTPYFEDFGIEAESRAPTPKGSRKRRRRP